MSTTRRGVGAISCATIFRRAIAEAIQPSTSERMMARANDSPPAGRTGAMEAHKNKTNHTTINRDAGGGMRGLETVKQLQQSADGD